ncbi:cation/H(+) antiporter 15-like [Typha latifolia]|uniref:cation/H(+) antiporter 15-like n=1 Tax=Typha latifolia TaxID=4733 RepID=UPI003C301A9E
MSNNLECFLFDSHPGGSNGIFQGNNPLQSSLTLLSVQVVLVVVVTRTLHFVFKPLKQPRVVTDIVSGIILGPSVLCRYPAFKETFFPDRGKPALDTVATFGLMYVIFVIGVKMDPGLVVRSGKKAVIIGLSGIFFAFTLLMGTMIFFVAASYVSFVKFVIAFSLSTTFSITSFAVLAPILSDLNLLNSELGRIAMSASMVNDGAGWFIMLFSIWLDASAVSWLTSVWAFLSIVALLVFVLCVVRPIAMWVIEQTPPGKPVDDGYIFIFLFIVLVVGFFSDIVGTNSFHGALVLGLVIPDGPPLGAALTEKIETMVSGLILPLYYVMTGMRTDLNKLHWDVLQLVASLAWCGKLVGVLIPSLYFKIPFRDAIALSLFMNAKGIVEVISFNTWFSNKMIDQSTFSSALIAIVLGTGVAVPLATMLYEPSRLYAVYKRRTVQHLKPDTDFRLIACVHEQSHVPATINLLESSCATINSPIVVYLLHLVELVGRSAPLFIPHKPPVRSVDCSSHGSSSQSLILASTSSTANVTSSCPIINAFLLHENRHPGTVSVHPFTTISPYSSMHHEVCRLAAEKRASLVILTFHRKIVAGGGAVSNNGLRNVNLKVIASAPCSVAILVNRKPEGEMFPIGGQFSHDIVVFFFGGGDDREALSYALRMTNHPSVSLTVIRFLPSRGVRDHMTDRRFDNNSLDEVKFVSMKNKRVIYREELVRDMEEIVEVIRTLDASCFDLVMVGMRQTWNTVLAAEEWTEWSEFRELGVVGDFLASSDFESKFSVLVVKQQDQATRVQLMVPGRTNMLGDGID